jgi:hypothetical protein
MQDRRKPRLDHKCSVNRASNADIKRLGNMVPKVKRDEVVMACAIWRLKGALEIRSTSVKHFHKVTTEMPHIKNGK